MPVFKTKRSAIRYIKKSDPTRRLRRRAIAPRYTAMPRAPTGSFCSRSETISLPTFAGVVNDYKVKLSDLPVCVDLAKYFQYYRITSIQMRFKPNSDTFAPGSGAFLPYLYFLYDKSGSLGALNSVQFEQCGAKPIRMDDKTIVRKWRPSVCIVNNDMNAQIPMFKSTPWIPTHFGNGTAINDDVEHLGAVFYVSKMNPADSQAYDIDVTVTVQFRKPAVTVSSPSEPPV